MKPKKKLPKEKEVNVEKKNKAVDKNDDSGGRQNKTERDVKALETSGSFSLKIN